MLKLKKIDHCEIVPNSSQKQQINIDTYLLIFHGIKEIFIGLKKCFPLLLIFQGRSSTV